MGIQRGRNILTMKKILLLFALTLSYLTSGAAEI